MAKADRVSKVVTAAVIEALNKDQSGLVAEITADVLNGDSSDDYGIYYSMLRGYGGRGKTHLEHIAREQVKSISADAVAEWFAERADDLKAKVRAKLDLDAIADSYVARLVAAASETDVEITVEYPTRDEDDD